MCRNCNIIAALFDAARDDAHKNYTPLLRFLEALEAQERIELFAGDCLLRETLEVLNSDRHFTVCHYLRCRQCGQLFFFGACIRGTPKYKLIDHIDEERISRMIWGNVGTKYDTKAP